MEWVFVILPLVLLGAGFWYGMYRLHAYYQTSRWEHGLDGMPDLHRLRFRYLICFLVGQAVFWWLLISVLSGFPGQR